MGRLYEECDVAITQSTLHAALMSLIGYWLGEGLVEQRDRGDVLKICWVWKISTETPRTGLVRQWSIMRTTATIPAAPPHVTFL
jgi:hypothetical protein